MNKYRITHQSTLHEAYEVAAESAEEALEKWNQGAALEPVETLMFGGRVAYVERVLEDE